MVGILHIGRTTSSLAGLRAPDACDYLELDLLRGPRPKPKALEQVRKNARRGLEFGVKVACPGSGLTASDGELTYEAARALSARWVVVGSDRDLRPGALSKAKLRDAFKRLESEAWQLAWQPQGLWEGNQAQEFAAEAGVRRVVDPLDPEGVIDAESRYFRVSVLSVRGALRPSQLTQLAEQLAEVGEEAYLVLPLRRVDVVARSLRALLASESDEAPLDEGLGDCEEPELEESEDESDLEPHES